MNKEIDFKKIMSRAPRVRLGDYIERSMANNSSLQYGVDLIEGVNSNGEFCKPKANTDNINLKPYKIVTNGCFVYNPSRLNIGSFAYRKDEGMCLVSHLYVVFRLNEKGLKVIDPLFLYLYCTRDEFFRIVTYRNFGSQRPEFNFWDMSEIEIPLPAIEVQREIVATYEGLKNIADENEALLEPLQAACHAYIVDCKAKYPSVELGDLIRLDEVVNKENLDYPFIGLNIKKEFMPTAANTDGLDKRKYKIIEKGKFVFSGMQTGRDIAIRLGLYGANTPALITSAYSTFVVDEEKRDIILPEFIFLLFNRSESDRLGWFLSDSSVRSNLDWERFCGIKIPLPPIEVQEAIVSIYHCMEEAKSFARDARELMKTICPALIQKAANTPCA